MVTAVALAALCGCSAQTDADVTSGDANSQGFEKLVDYYDLPRDMRSLKWVETRDWDSNQIYIQVTLEASSARILAGFGVKLENVRPYARACRDSLPRSSEWKADVPDEALGWGPEPGSVSQCGSGHANIGRGYWSDALIAYAPDNTHADVYLHLTQT
jgi:hypothetical protein